jgi:hypothetical protein
MAGAAAEWIRISEDSELAVWLDLWRTVPIPVAAETGTHCVAAQGSARRIRDGLALGCTAFATETGLLADKVNHSYNNMLRYGFRKVCERPNYLHRRPAR